MYLTLRVPTASRGHTRHTDMGFSTAAKISFGLKNLGSILLGALKPRHTTKISADVYREDSGFVAWACDRNNESEPVRMAWHGRTRRTILWEGREGGGG